MARVTKPKQRWDGAGKNKKQRESRKKPIPNSLMRSDKNMDLRGFYDEII